MNKERELHILFETVDVEIDLDQSNMKKRLLNIMKKYDTEMFCIHK